MSIAKFYQRIRGNSPSSSSRQHTINADKLPPLMPFSATDIFDNTVDDLPDEWATRLNDGFETNWNEEAA